MNFNKKIEEADNLLQRGKPSLAVNVIKDVLKESPQDPYSNYLLGIARMKCGRFFLAKEAIDRANDLDPNNPENLRSLGWVLVMLGRVDEGRNYLRSAISLDLTNPLTYLDLAMSYFSYFDFKEGLEWLERAKALEPKNEFVIKCDRESREMEKDLLRHSSDQLEKMKREKMDLENQKKFRLIFLEKFLKTGLSKEEADEVAQELKLNGVDAGIMKTNYDFDELPPKNEILKRRKEIEKEISRELKKIKSPFAFDHIKDIIYHEKSSDDFSKIVSIFDKGQKIEELNKILEIANEAWNYFPHKLLGGLCPVEKIIGHGGEELRKEHLFDDCPICQAMKRAKE